MKYTFNSLFYYDEDDSALLGRLTALFAIPFFQDSVLRSRSLKAPPTESLLAAEQGLPKPEAESEILWQTVRDGRAMTGKLALTRNSGLIGCRFTSYLDFKFSLGATWKGGVFTGPDELIVVTTVLMEVGPSVIGIVETSDEPLERKCERNNRFRTVDTLSVPESRNG